MNSNLTDDRASRRGAARVTVRCRARRRRSSWLKCRSDALAESAVRNCGTWLVVALAGLLLAACKPGGAPGGGFGGFPPAPVTLLTTQARSVPIRFEYVGQAAGSKEAEVRARVQGVLERRSYQEGARVKAGQPLFLIDPKPYSAELEAAEAALAIASAQHAQAKRDLDRLRPLVGDRAISRREYDSAVSSEEASSAAVKQARARLVQARLNLSYTTVTAPVSGLASKSLKSEGSLVSPGADSLLTTISQFDPMHVDFAIAENEQLRIDRLRAEGKLLTEGAASYSVRIVLADGGEFAHKGRLAFIDPRINPATGSFDARAVVPNPQGSLHPGQFVRVVLDGAKRPDAIAIPQRAVLEGPQGKFVYVAGKSKDGKDVAIPRPVVVSDWVTLDGEKLWVVDSGLAAGERVIVEGMAKIFPIPGGAPIMVGPPAGAAPGSANPQQH